MTELKAAEWRDLPVTCLIPIRRNKSRNVEKMIVRSVMTTGLNAEHDGASRVTAREAAR